MEYSTIAIIYNPNSTGSGESLAQQLRTELKARMPAQKIELVQTERAGHGEDIAYQLATTAKNPLVISSSGDGGYNDIVNGIMRAKKEGHSATTGLLPAGNANDHYHNLHMGDTVERIATGDESLIDVLKISGLSGGKPIERYAHSYIGFGLTPQVGKELNKTQLNPAKEAWIVLRSLLTVRPVRLRVGDKVRAYESIILSNIDVMSKYLKISQPSSVRDGKFEVTIFRRRNKFKLIMTLLRASLSGVKEDRKTAEFSLSTVRRTLAQADGEIIVLDASSDVVVTIEQHALNCII